MAEPFLLSRRVKVAAPVGAVWPFVSDTDRANRAAGYPKVTYEPPPPGSAARRAHAVNFGLPMVWSEQPFDWAENDHLWVERLFESGPIRRMEVGFRLLARDEASSEIEVFGVVTPAGPVSSLAAKPIARLMLNSMTEVMEGVALHAAGRAANPLRPEVPREAVNRPRLEELLRRAGESADRAVLARLGRLLEYGADNDAAMLRPFELADRWGTDRLATLGAFLHATRAGALDMRWELLCPHCRVAKASTGTLAEVKASAHCDFCDLDFEAELDVNMEVRFTPNPTVRAVSSAVFCIGGPASKPHRPAQFKAPEGGVRRLNVPLRAKRYLLRGLLGTSELTLIPDAESGVPRVSARASGGEVAEGEARFKPGSVEISLENAGPELWAVVEEVDWSDTAATAAFVTRLQEFRDLFSSEVLAAGTEVSVRSLALLFTDLKGSTAMYEAVGDARAYSVVRAHFEVLFDVVRRRRGAVVKTIGDAVMAAFNDPADAVAAAFEMHDALHERNKTLKVPVVLKVGVHEGPAIAINAGGALDYFGTTVNLAARVQSESEGGDVVLTAPLLASSAVAALTAGVRRTDFETTVKGLSAPVRLCRLWPRSSLDAGLGGK